LYKPTYLSKEEFFHKKPEKPCLVILDEFDGYFGNKSLVIETKVDAIQYCACATTNLSENPMIKGIIAFTATTSQANFESINNTFVKKAVTKVSLPNIRQSQESENLCIGKLTAVT
jgi:hypothetical protein